MTAVALVECIMSISGYFEYSSITTRIYTPVGKGPKKSAQTSSQGPVGNSDIRSGSGLGAVPLAWHGMHSATIPLVHLCWETKLFGVVTVSSLRFHDVLHEPIVARAVKIACPRCLCQPCGQLKMNIRAYTRTTRFYLPLKS